MGARKQSTTRGVRRLVVIAPVVTVGVVLAVLVAGLGSGFAFFSDSQPRAAAVQSGTAALTIVTPVQVTANQVVAQVKNTGAGTVRTTVQLPGDGAFAPVTAAPVDIAPGATQTVNLAQPVVVTDDPDTSSLTAIVTADGPVVTRGGTVVTGWTAQDTAAVDLPTSFNQTKILGSGDVTYKLNGAAFDPFVGRLGASQTVTASVPVDVTVYGPKITSANLAVSGWTVPADIKGAITVSAAVGKVVVSPGPDTVQTITVTLTVTAATGTAFNGQVIDLSNLVLTLATNDAALSASGPLDLGQLRLTEPIKARDDSASVAVGGSVDNAVLNNDDDFGASPAVTLVAADSHGTWSVATVGGKPVVRFTAAAGYVGAARATYKVVGNGYQSTADVLVAVGPVMEMQADLSNSGVVNNTFSFYLSKTASQTLPVTVDWGDGSQDVVSGPGNQLLTHRYADSGTHTVRIIGVFNTLGDAAQTATQLAALDAVTLWGENAVTNLSHGFYQALNLASSVEPPSTVTTYDHLFQNTAISSAMSGWKTGHVTNMAGMFQGAAKFDQDITSWNTANVTDMSHMFDGASSFSQRINTANGPDGKAGTADDYWNTSNVTNMEGMFAGAVRFNQQLQGWSTAKVTNMSNMFNGATAFNQDVKTFNTANVTTMAGMFQGAVRFNKALNTDSWDTAKVTDMANMFNGATAFNQDVKTFKTANVTTMAGMFQGAVSFNKVLNTATWNTAKVTDMSNMFNGARTFNQDVKAFNTASVTTMVGMFQGAVRFNKDLNTATWNTAKVIDMSHMFDGAKAFDGKVGSWNTAAVKTMVSMFDGATSFSEPLNTWNTTAVTDMSRMFYNALKVNQPLNTWNTAAVTSMTAMFYGAKAFDQNISTWVVRLIPTKPVDFDGGGTLATWVVAEKPAWGAGAQVMAAAATATVQVGGPTGPAAEVPSDAPDGQPTPEPSPEPEDNAEPENSAPTIRVRDDADLDVVLGELGDQREYLLSLVDAADAEDGDLSDRVSFVLIEDGEIVVDDDGEPVPVDLGAAGVYRLRAVATDSVGVTARVSLEVRVSEPLAEPVSEPVSELLQP